MKVYILCRGDECEYDDGFIIHGAYSCQTKAEDARREVIKGRFEEGRARDLEILRDERARYELTPPGTIFAMDYWRPGNTQTREVILIRYDNSISAKIDAQPIFEESALRSGSWRIQEHEVDSHPGSM